MSGVKRGETLQSLMALQGNCLVVGHAGHSRGLYLDHLLDVMPCQVLVDTGSTTSPMRPGTLPSTLDSSSTTWIPSAIQLTTVTGERTKKQGKKTLRVEVQGKGLNHSFWLAPIQQSCILGLDFLTNSRAIPHPVSPYPGCFDSSPAGAPPGKREKSRGCAEDCRAL